MSSGPALGLLITWVTAYVAYSRRKRIMSEIVGLDISKVGHAGVKLEGGKLVAALEIDGAKVVDLVIDAAEGAIPGDFDKPLLEVVRAAAKAALVKA